MALKLSFDICQANDCSSLVFKDTTGVYDATNNPTGYGDPNVDPADIHYARIEFFLNGVSVKVIEYHNVTLPSLDPNFEVDLDYEIPDGIYKIVYSVGQDDFTDLYGQVTCYQGFWCNVACCVMSMFKGIDHECDCSQDQKTKALNAYALLKGLEYSANSGNVTNFNKDLAILNKLCLNIDCSTCK